MPQLFGGRKPRRTPRIEIIPMVDVMFLLLVFYILSSLALHRDRGIPVQLPSAQSGEAGAARKENVLTVTPAGEYFLNKDKIELADLESQLEALPGGLAAVRQQPMILNADMSAQHRHFVKAVDALRKLEIFDFVIAIDPEGGAAAK